MARKANPKAEAIKHGIVLFVLSTAFYPLFLMLVVSLKSNEQYQANPWFFDAVDTWKWENWSSAWLLVKDSIANSIFVTTISTIVCLIITIFTSYVVARYRFPGRNIVYYGIIASMFLPGTAASLVTLFDLLDSFHLINTLSAIVLVFAVGGQVTGIFILKQFIEDIPKELFESAQIDGAGHIRQITTIVLPMAGSIIGVVAILKFLGTWNQVILPLVVLRDPELWTMPVNLLYLEGEYVKQWGQMMAGYAIASVPLILLFIFTMRLFVKGLAAGAIKG